MRKIFIVFTVISIILTCVVVCQIYAQTMKTSASVSPAYTSLSQDMQYYEVKYDPNSKEYASYYKIVREKLMRKLNSLYRNNYKKGDVYLLFKLKSDGSLTRFDIDGSRSTQDKMLINIVTASLKQSSPFPRFPKVLDISDLSFSIVISFREE